MDSEHIYWTSPGELVGGIPQDGEGTIGRAVLGAAEGEEVDESYVTGASNPQGVAVGVEADSEHLYWANAGSEVNTRTIGRAKLGATEGEEVNQGFVAVDFGIQQNFPRGLAVNGTKVYFAYSNDANGFVASIDISGEEATKTVLLDGFGVEARGLALDNTHVYWARTNKDTIGRANLDFTSPEREFTTALGAPEGLAADSSHLYWSHHLQVAPNRGNDLYRFDAESGEIEDVVPDAGDEDGADVQGLLGASEDGRRVYFAANGVLAAGASPGNCGGFVTVGKFLSFSGQCSIYLAEEDSPGIWHYTFVGRLNVSGEADALNWIPRGQMVGQKENTARASADGSTLLFRSKARITEYDSEGIPELYRWQIGDAEPTCISCNPTGEAPTAGAGFANIVLPQLTPPAPASTLSRNLSADGSRVFFQTTDRLVGADVNGLAECPLKGGPVNKIPACQDVYEWEATGSGTCSEGSPAYVPQNGGCLYLLSSGTSDEASFLLDASRSGEDAFFITRSQLVPSDQDDLPDVYDARVGGGLASQHPPPPPPPCEEEACKGPAGSAPQQTPAASAGFSGPANPAPKRPRCPKGKRAVKKKGHIRCVARHPKHHRHSTKRRNYR